MLAWDRAHRPAAVPGDRVAGPPAARRAPRLADRAAELTAHHRPAARPVLRRAQDDLAAGEPDRRRRGHHHRHLAAAPARRAVRDRRRHRVPDDAARPGRGRLVGGRLRRVRHRPGRSCPRWRTARGSWRDDRVRRRRCRSPGSPSTSRRPCWPRAALPPGDAKCTYGTGAFLLVTTGSTRGHGPARAVRSVAWRLARRGDVLPGRPGLHGGLGAALADQASGCSARRPSSTRVGGTVPDTGGVHLRARAGRARRAVLGAGCARLADPVCTWAPSEAPGPRRGRGHRRLGRAAGLAALRATSARRWPRCGWTAA